MDFSFFHVGYLMSLDERLRDSIVASACFDYSNGRFQRDHVPSADVHGFASLFGRDCCADNLTVVFQEGGILAFGVFNLAEQPTLCDSYRGSTYYETKVAGQTAAVGVCESLAVDEEEVRLQMQLLDAQDRG
jgi:hypothetical protein